MSEKNHDNIRKLLLQFPTIPEGIIMDYIWIIILIVTVYYENVYNLINLRTSSFPIPRY